MTDPRQPDDSDAATPLPEGVDPDALQQALSRTGKLLSHAGLPFDEDEFDDTAEVEAARTDDGSGQSSEAGAQNDDDSSGS